MRYPVYKLLNITLSLFLLLCAVTLHAQNGQFLNEVPLTQAGFTQSEQDQWQALSQKTNTLSIRLIQVSELANFITDNQFAFSIPGEDQIIQAQGGYFIQEPNGDYIWMGNFTNATGSVGVGKNSAGTYVQIQKDNRWFQIHPLSDRYNALIETGRGEPKEEICPPTIELPENITTNPSACVPMNDCQDIVSVLVLVTPEAMNAMGISPLQLHRSTYLWFGVNSANFALLNSGIFGKTFRFIIEPYNFEFTGSTSFFPDMVRLENDQNAHDRKIETRADLMVLLTNDRYQDALGVWLENFDGPGQFGMVAIEHMTGLRNVFAHELGHAHILNHNRVSNGGDEYYEDDNACNFGWRFQDMIGAYRHTIMATLYDSQIEAGETSILNYSNPDVIFNGVPTGNTINANAYKLSLEMCNVATIFPGQELKVDISGPDVICDEQATYDAFIHEPPTGQPGSGPYTFSWWKSTTGYFNTNSSGSNPFGQFLGTTQSIQVFSDVVETFWLMVFVHSSDGVVASQIIKVESCGGFSGGGEERQSYASAEEIQTFSLSPNPAQNKISLRIGSSAKGSSEYSISNSLGQIVASGVIESVPENGFDINLPEEKFNPGTYYFALRNGLFFEIKTFTVAR